MTFTFNVYGELTDYQGRDFIDSLPIQNSNKRPYESSHSSSSPSLSDSQPSSSNLNSNRTSSSHLKSSDGLLLKDRALYRVAWSKRDDIPDLFDETASIKYALDRCQDWEESICKYKSNQSIEIFSNHIIPWRHSKDLKISVDLSSDDTTVSLYSSTDFSLCIRTPSSKHHLQRRPVGTNLIFLKFKTTQIAKQWLWSTWLIKNSNKIPKNLDVRMPSIGGHVQFPIETTDPSKLSSSHIVNHCMKLVKTLDIRGIDDIHRKQTKFALCWRRGKYGLEWIPSTANYEDVLVGFCMVQSQRIPKIEFKRAQYEPVAIKLDIHNTIYPPKPIEGFLNRITLISQKRSKVYLTSHDSFIFALKPSNIASPSNDPEIDLSRCNKQIKDGYGFIEMRHIISIRRVIDHNLSNKDKWPYYIDGELFNDNENVDDDEDDDIGGDTAFENLNVNERNNLHNRRQFEIELITGVFVKFEASSAKASLKWIRSLGKLCAYWSKRARTYANLLMEITTAGLGPPNSGRSLNQYPTNNTKDDSPQVEDPDAAGPLVSKLWNHSVLNTVKPIVKSGKCFVRKSFRGGWNEFILILTSDGMLHRYDPAPLNANVRKSKKAQEVLNRKKSSIPLHHAFVLTSDDIVLVNSNNDDNNDPSRGSRMSSRRSAKAPDRLYDDGLIVCESEPSDLALMLWVRTNSSKKTVESLDKSAEKFEIRTRSRLERDHWCWCLEVVINKISKNNNEQLRNVSGI